MVEYSLLVALVAVVSLVAVKSLQDSGGEELSDRGDQIGTPVENSSFAAPGGGLPNSGGSSGGGATTTNVSIPVFTGSATNDGNKWTATVTITIRDSSNNPVGGVRVVGSWTGPSSPAGSCFTSASSGTCTITLDDINDNRPNTTFTVSDIEDSTTTVVGTITPAPPICLQVNQDDTTAACA